jgi:hypothetical protein
VVRTSPAGDCVRLVVALRDRDLFHIADSRPAAYYIADREIGGVLVNAPPFEPALLDALAARAELRYIFLPSARGAQDLDAWRAASGAESLATEAETATISGTVDLVLYAGRKLSRTIDFLPMSGVTAGSCALRIKTNGGVLFCGPILEPGTDGWPALVAHTDDASPENRLIGALGLQDIAFEYVFTDVFEEGRTRYGPGAGHAVKKGLRQVLEAG